MNYKSSRSNEALAFILDLLRVYEKHQLSLSHEDHHGEFIIEHLSQINKDWLQNAGEDTE